MKPKYIVYEVINTGIQEAKIFSAWENHCDIANPLLDRSIILGAGEFSLGIDADNNIQVSCFGKSTTLDIKSRGEDDSRVIRQLLRIGEFT